MGRSRTGTNDSPVRPVTITARIASVRIIVSFRFHRSTKTPATGPTRPTAAPAEWREARTPNFTVYSDGSERQLRTFAARLEDFDRLLRKLTGTATPPAERLAVFLVASAGEIAETIGMTIPNVRGFYAAQFVPSRS